MKEAPGQKGEVLAVAGESPVEGEESLRAIRLAMALRGPLKLKHFDADTLRTALGWDDALAASDRALAKVYGPRKLVVLRARADIYAAKGDPAAAKKTLEEALAFAEGLPDGQRSDALIASLKKKIDAMP